MRPAIINAAASTEEAKRALQSAIVDAFMDFFRVRFDETLTEVGGMGRAEYLRGRVAVAKEKLQSLRDLEKRERDAEARRREIKRENEAHRRRQSKPQGNGR